MSAPVTVPDLAAQVEALAAQVARLAAVLEEIRGPLTAFELTADVLIAAGRQRYAEGLAAGLPAPRMPRTRLRPVPDSPDGAS